MKINDYNWAGSGEVKLFFVDRLTNEPLEGLIFPTRKNNASPLAPEIAIRNMLGFVDQGAPNGPTTYAITRIQWGTGVGMVGAPFDSLNPDLESFFTPRVFTPITNYDNPAIGVARILSYIDDTVVPVGTQVQEAGLYTNPLSGYPNGICLARYQHPSPVEINNTRARLGIEWTFTYVRK